MGKRRKDARAGMDGILDWLKSVITRAAPPVPGLPPPAERLPGLPAPPSGGMIVRPATPPARAPSIFEAFAPSREIALPPVPQETLPSIFEAPASGLLRRLEEKVRAIIPAAPPPPMLPAEIPPPAEPEAPIWEAMFPRPAEAEPELPTAEFFTPFAPAEPEPAPPPPGGRLMPAPGALVPFIEATEWTREYPDIAERTQGRMPLWVAFDLGWQVPPTWAVLEMIERAWDLPLILEQALRASDDPFFRRTAEQAGHTGEPAELEIMEVGRWGDPYRDVARFLGIPENVIEMYLRQPTATDMFWTEVLSPMLQRMTKAMEFTKPPGLRGWFEISPAHDGTFWLKYKETRQPQ